MTVEPRIGPGPESRRSFPRAHLAIRVRYSGPRGGFKEGYINELGGGGLFVEAIKPLPLGTPIRIELALPGSDTIISASGRVAWVRAEFDPKGVPPGMGVEFQMVSPYDRQRIVDIVMRILMGRPIEGA